MKFKSVTYYISLVIALLFCNACIKNDIPYPHVQVDYLTMVAEGESNPANIDTKNRIVTLYFPENVNIGAAKITSYTITDGATLVSPDFNNPINLRSDITSVLHMYYDYNWTITANQSIERYFNVEGQIGASVIDVPGKRAVVNIPQTANISAVKVQSIKLGPAEVTTMTPDLNGKTVDFSQPVTVEVSYFDIKETWTLYVQKTSVSVAIDEVDAWTKVIWAYGTGQAGKDNGFQYRVAGSNNWLDVPASDVTHDGGAFKARINNLQETTSYEVRAYSGTDFSAVSTVSTSAILTIPNMMLDEWSLDGKVWNPWAQGSSSFWDTGNKGATTLGDSNSVPAPITWNGEPGQCAMLQTKFVGIAGIGKLAAGNLFTGQFVKVDGTNGILNFGREFTGRPTRLHGYCKYTTSPINYTNTTYADLKGRPDTATVYMALTDWNAPYEIRTNPKNQQLFDPNAPEVIAYGTVQYGSNIDNFTEFVVNLDYRDTKRVPKYILIVCSASKYGDYFTGGSSSVLYVSNLWFDWSY